MTWTNGPLDVVPGGSAWVVVPVIILGLWTAAIAGTLALFPTVSRGRRHGRRGRRG